MSDLNKKKREEESGARERNEKTWLLVALACIFGTKWYFHMRLSQTKGQL